MPRLRERVDSSFYLRYSYTYRLKNLETGAIILFRKNAKGSPHFQHLETQARDWLEAEDEKRLGINQIDRPSTKWAFIRFLFVEVKVLLVRQAPLLGTGPLPDWLRRKREMYSLDTYGDNLCLFRCIAVHRGARVDCCTRQARAFASKFFKAPDTPATSLDDLRKVEAHFQLGIRVYEPVGGDWLLRRQPLTMKKWALHQ